MNAVQINEKLFSDNSKYIGEVINDCEIIGYRNSTKQFLLQCTKCGAMLVRSRATVTLHKCKCECQYTRNTRHTDGFCGTKLKSIYMNMIDRCYNENNHAYKDYGARGIGVCGSWTADFRDFYEWAIENGYKEGLTLDRINNDGWYAPQNCRWVDRKTQANNRRSNHIVIVFGEPHTIAEAAEMLGIKYQTLYARIKREGDEIECTGNK